MKATDYSSFKSLQEIVDNLYDNRGKMSDHERRRNDALKECASECESIKEFGVFQGSSLAVMTSTNPKKVVGVDLNLKPFKSIEHLFLKYIRENNIHFTMLQCSSLDIQSVGEIDMLHIDSLHNAVHLTKELELHGHLVNKYIAFHDVLQNNRELGKVVEKYISKNSEWKMKEHGTEGKCGFMIIQKN